MLSLDIKISFSLIFAFVILRTSETLEDIIVPSDESVITGSKVTLSCIAEGTKGLLRDCRWRAPSATVYSELDEDNEYRGVRVHIQERTDVCYLDIDRVRLEESGPWECILEDDRKALGKFVFLAVHDPVKDNFKVISDIEEKEKEVVQGRDIDLLCRSNHLVSKPGERTTCIWIDPSGRSYEVIGSHGEVYEYWTDGILPSGDPDSGECGIKIKRVEAHHSGFWKCQMLRKSVKGHGSDVTVEKIFLDVLRSGKYGTLPSLQGYLEGDRDIVISLVIPKPKYSHNIVFYWVIQRTYLVYEGDRNFCLKSTRVCYNPKRRRNYTGGPERLFILELEISEVTIEDLESPITLIMEYGQKTKEDKYYSYVSKIFKVPKKVYKRHPRRGNNGQLGFFK